MAKLSQRRTRRLTLLLIVAASTLAAAAEAEDAAPTGAAVDLTGTWHVLIHYTDDHAHDPEQLRWDDKIWVFEPSGSRLRWTEYPIVVFEDQTGRFENLGGSHAARVTHAWQPNEAQRAQIASGLEVNKRGSKTKTLRRQADGSWASAARSTAASASIVTYVESWTIRGLADAPVFRREDSLGSGTTESYDGATEYATTEILFEGNVLRGTFERDETRHGVFQLTRAGTVEGVKGSGKSQSERLREAGWDFAPAEPD